MEQVKLEAGQLDGGVGNSDDAAFHVHAEAARARNDRGWFGVVVLCAAQNGLDARHQFADTERLDDVIVRAEFEADDAVNLLAARRNHDDRHVAGLAEFAAHVEAVHFGDHQVEQDQVGLEFPREAQGRAPIRGDLHIVQRLAEVVCQQIGDRGLVIHDEDAMCHARRITWNCGRRVSGGGRGALQDRRFLFWVSG